MKKIIAIGVVLLSFTFPHATCQTVSPLDYGLREATSGMGRYYALYNAHSEALQRGVEVSYEGIDSLDIELPPGWHSIPLGPRTDFGGLVLTVTNRVSHGSLFSLSNTAKPIELDKALVDGLDYGTVPELARGTHLLVLNDRHPWTERQGYGYKAYRADIVVVSDGRAQNATVAPWNTDSTLLSATVYDVDTLPKLFRGLTMHRTKESTYKTYCLSARGQLNLSVEKVYVTTPRSKMIADGVFSISCCARLRFLDDTVHGTYSGYGRTRNYGYAFSLNNIYGSTFERVEAEGNWGVFGSNNLNNTTLIECNIDRFDVHCYGRDARLERCTLRGRQTSITSFYGTVVLDSCHFIDYTPVAVRASYNAYPPFDAVIRNCTFELTPRYHAIVCINLLDTATNPRPELREKCWPNLTVDGLTVVVPWTVGRLDIYDPDGNLDCLGREVGHLERVSIKGLRTVRASGREVKIPIRLSSHPFKSKKEIQYDLQTISN